MTRIIPAVIGLVIALTPDLAAAKLSCYPLKQIENALEAEYGDQPIFTGREAGGIEYRLYVNAQTGSWTWIGIPVGTFLGCLIFDGRAARVPVLATPPSQSVPKVQF
jgi:hypothetical protein